jgi:TRAP-type C4-dicarboxylate transport system permease small subunit
MRRLLTWLQGIEDALLVLVLGAMIALAGTQILLRNLWGTGFAWTDPLLRLLVLWVGLLGAMAATRAGRHIDIDVLSRLLPERLRRPCRRLTDLFTSLVCALLAYHAGRFVWADWSAGTLAFATVPAWAGELILPLGFAVMTARFLLAALLAGGQPPTQDR